ncbi:MAG: polysaccharide pyruvyl transferase family protein [Ruminococcaceae bacterium]|nr:polysaccharide pyruvyl transferase family protein [Oscillospiraceae bacterium]
MRIGILSFPGSPSHGAALQMFALYQTLMQLGHTVEIINYIPDRVIHKRVKDNSFRGKMSDVLCKIFLKDTETSFKRFEGMLHKYPAAPVGTTEAMQELSGRYDRIIVGSDQVWNPVVTGNDFNYYLDFSTIQSQKASYAPSFGNETVAMEDKAKVAALLSEFPFLCAREKQGAEIIYTLTGQKVPVVLDPTFLVDGAFWRQHKKPSGAEGRYVFLYTIKPSLNLCRIANQFAEANGYHLVYIDGGVRGIANKFNPKIHPVFGVGPAEFLDLIDNAEYVFTNSFHGTALSINLHTKFYVEYSSDTNSRLTNLIDLVGLEQCVVTENLLENPPITIDYDVVETVLQKEKQFSMDYLCKVVAE